jgi:hypothetical protein
MIHTGRAAQRLREQTSSPCPAASDDQPTASTIHRGLGYGNWQNSKSTIHRGLGYGNWQNSKSADSDSDDEDEDKAGDSSHEASSADNGVDFDEEDLQKLCRHGKKEKLPHSKLLVDECSMITLPLQAALLNAVK